MRRIFTILLILISGIFYNCRAQDVITKIADSCCAFLHAMDTTQGPDAMSAQLDGQLEKFALPYKDELKSRFNIDINDQSGKQWETLGQLIGGKMVIECPDLLMILARAEEKAAQQDVAPQFYEGFVTEIQKTMFATVIIKDTYGQSRQLLWLGYFTNSELLKNPAQIKSSKMKFDYEEYQFYDPQTEHYAPVKVLTGIEPE